ncbi:MAG: hypothetical protein ACOC3Z_02630, partial [Nanoarchaeota archaeon]
MAIIYFDQRVWIDLLKAKKGIEQYKQYLLIYKKVLETSKNKVHTYPLSICHLIETQKRKKKDSMKELFEFIFKVTKFISIRPWTSMYHLEINSAISKIIGLQTIDLRYFVFNKGLGHCFNSKEEIIDNKTKKSISKNQKEEIMKKIYQPKQMAEVLSFGHWNEQIEKTKKNDEDLRKKLEELRKKEYSHPDKNRRKDIDDVRFFTTTMQKYILEGVMNYSIKKIDPKKFVEDVFYNKKSALNFLKNIPSAYIFHIINYERNNNKSRA